MPLPSVKVSAMASIFQSRPRSQVEERDEDNVIEEKVRKGRVSLSVFGETEVSKHKALLKRTKSQKDRFSSTRKMWESRGSDRLNTSNSSITSPGSFRASSKSESNVEERFSSARKMWESRGSDCLNTSINSSIAFDGSFNATPKSDKRGEIEAKETAVENNSDEPKFKILLQQEHEVKQDNCMDKDKSIESSPFQIETLCITESSPPEAEVLSGKSVSVLVTEDAELDVSVFDTDAELGDGQNSPQPPPLPSLPPPTSPDLIVQGHCIPFKASPDILQTRLPVTLAKIKGVDTAISLEEEVDRSSDAPLIMVVEEERLTYRSDSQDTLLEYAELCETLPSLDYDKAEEEFDRLSNMADSDHSEEEPGCNIKVVEGIRASPGLSPCKGYPGQTSNTTNFPMESDALDAIPDEPKYEVMYKNIVDSKTTEITSNLDEGCLGPVSIELMENVADLSRFETPTQSVNKSTTVSDGGNTSSLGSSLVGQSVTSWLDTPGSVSTESSCVSVNPSPEAMCTDIGLDNHDLDPSIGESSDYVSGNSVELESSSTTTTEVSLEPCLNGMDDKIHHLSDGNFWVEGSPLVPTSVLENTNPFYHHPSKVKFSTSPVRIYSTFTDAEYDRKNEDIDPAAASAEYELEKRVENMETFEVKLTKGEDGLGLSILGMGVGVDTGVEKLGIYIKTLTAGGTAAKDGRMKVNDQIISVDGSSLVGVTQEFAASVLRNTTGLVTFVIGRDKDPGESEVAKIIRQCVEADMDQEVKRDGSIIEINATEDTAEEEGGNDPYSSTVESRQFEAGNGDGMAWLDKFSKYLHRDGSKELDDNYTPGNLSGDDKNTTIEWEEKCKDPLKTFVNSSIISVDREKEDLNIETSVECCTYRKIYPSLLIKYDEAQETIEQLRRNLSIVTEQLVTRDQLFSSHIARLKEVFSHLEDQFECKADNKSFWLSLEPRGALRRKPFIPDELSLLASSLELSGSCLDQAIPPTPVLDNSLAREKVRLVHRGTFARRKKGKPITTTTSFVEDSSSLPVVNDGISSMDYDTMPTDKGSQGPGSAFQEELRKKILNGISVIKSTEFAEKVVLPTNKACSLPTSPAGSPYRSTSSIQSVPGSEESPTEFKREKKRLSGKKLWNKARRRLSSR